MIVHKPHGHLWNVKIVIKGKTLFSKYNSAHRSVYSIVSKLRSNNARQNGHGYTNISRACISESKLRLFHVSPFALEHRH